MNECSGRYFILNGELRPEYEFDSSLVYEGDSVYEVIRIADGIPVFFDDHYARLKRSIESLGKAVIPVKKALSDSVNTLITECEKKDVNLKVVVNFTGNEISFLAYSIETIYPNEVQYSSGVRGILYYAERKDPSSKVVNAALRNEIYQRLITEGAYEALLVNRYNCITEGSRSNIFFLKGCSLITAPDNAVLAGITRLQLINICREQNIPILYECIDADSIKEFDGVFMSGTSPVVLPFSSIGNLKFRTGHSLFPLLRELYWEKAGESMRKYAAGDLT